jgi:hypothetical protein
MRIKDGREGGIHSVYCSGYRTEAIDVLLSFNFAVIFNFYIFSFLPCKTQFLRDVLMNRQNAANCSLPF